MNTTTENHSSSDFKVAEMDATQLGANSDAFTHWSYQIFDNILKNKNLALSILVVSIGMGVGWSVYQAKVEQKSKLANNELYLAKVSLERDLKKLAGVEKGADAGTEQKIVDASFAKVDVDQTFGATVQQLKKVVEAAPGTRPSFEAAQLLTTLYMNHGQSNSALIWAEKATQIAPNPLDLAYAYWSLGAAFENLEKPSDAAKAYEKGVGKADGALKAELLLALARAQLSNKEVSQAQATFERVKKEFAGTEASRVAEAQLQSLTSSTGK